MTSGGTSATRPPAPPWRRFTAGLPTAIAVGALAGAVAGGVQGWHYLNAGFPLLLLRDLRHWLEVGLLAAAGFLALFALLLPLARRLRLPPAVATAVAAAVAGTPLLAGAGLVANRAWGIHPSEVFAPFALERNLGLVAAGIVAWALAAFALQRGAAARPPERRRRRLVFAAALVAAVALLHAALAVAFHAGPLAPERTNVIVLLVDALRADHLGCYGYARPTSPAIDALARDSVLFRQTIPASTFTKSSVASLFTGRYPFQHGVYWGNSRENADTITSDVLSARETTLAEVFRAHGYLTAAWVQNSHLRGFMGFAQGFVDYHDQQGSIDRIDRLFGDWLAGPGRRYPFFTYVHYIDLHDPYRPPPPYDSMFGRYADVYKGVDFSAWGAFLAAVRKGERKLTPEEVAQLAAYYDGEIRYVDERIGRLLARLKRLGLYDRSLIVLIADHGDAFYEHGFISHSTTPYEELVHVPLIVKLPGERLAGRVVTPQVRLVDLFPTLLDLTGIAERPDDLAGCSLTPLLRAEPPAERDSRCQVAVIEIAEEGEAPGVAVRTARWKYIHHEKHPDELYDLAADPGEKNNLLLLGPPGDQAAKLRALALQVVAERHTTGGERIELDDQLIRELKALGYIDR